MKIRWDWKLNVTLQLLVYADDVNLLGDTIKNTETLIDACKKFGLEVMTEKSRYMLLSRHKIARKNHDMKLANKCCENVAPDSGKY
jgi:hypothetical protein